jgi:hypothetical protein
MRRIRALAVIIALLATPLALLARGMACEANSTTMMCCAVHGSHSHRGQAMACHCATKSGTQAPDFGLIAPIAPTKVTSLARFANPEMTGQAFAIYTQSAAPGFFPAPFEPPRA